MCAVLMAALGHACALLTRGSLTGPRVCVADSSREDSRTICSAWATRVHGSRPSVTFTARR
eukprot:2933108-Rhodomonas_salina.2